MDQNPKKDNVTELSKLPRGAISIRGIPAGRNSRLPSFKSPRDLTLGSGIKRTFTPNIPIRHKKNLEKASNSSKPNKKDTSKATRSSHNHVQTRSSRKAFVQTPGIVFGEGINQVPKKATAKSCAGNRIKSNQPSSKLRHARVRVKTEPSSDGEDSDNFIDDSDIKLDWRLGPVELPLTIETDSKEKTSENPPTCVKMEDPLEESVPVKTFEKLSLNSDIINSEELFLFELPNYCCFTKEGVSSIQNADSNKSMMPDWSKIDEGYVGKLQFLSNGKTQLKIGNCTFDGVLSEPSPFLQELVAMESFENHVQMDVVGNIKHSIRFLPKVDEM